MPGRVVGLKASVLVPDLLASEMEIAVMIADVGSPAMMFGAVYVAVSFPVDAIEPSEADQVTPRFCESLFTLAEKFAV